MTHDQVNTLFDATIAHLEKMHGRGRGLRERHIFTQAMGDTQEVREHFLTFLHDVSTCPPEVVAWCQQQLRTPIPH